MGIVTGPRSGSVTGNNRLVLGQRRKQEEQQAIEEAQEVGSRVRFGSSPASIPQPLPRMSGALEMDDTSGSFDTGYERPSNTPIQDAIARGASKVANLPGVKQTLEGMGKAYDAFQSLPVVDNIGGALSGGLDNLNADFFKLPKLTEIDDRFREKFSDFRSNPSGGIDQTLGAMREGWNNPTQAKQSLQQNLDRQTEGMGPVAKFIGENWVQGYADPLTYAAGPLGVGIERGVKGLKGLADNAVNEVTKDNIFAVANPQTSGLNPPIGRTVQSPTVLRRTNQAQAGSAFEQFDMSMQQKYNPQNAEIDILPLMKPKERKTYSELQTSANKFKSTVNAPETPTDNSFVLGNTNILPEAKKPVQANVEPETKVRSNYTNQQNNGNFSNEFYQAQSKRDLTYEPQSNKETMERVNKRFREEPRESIEADFMDEKAQLSADHTAIGYRLMQKFDQEAARTTDPILKETYLRKAIQVSDKLAKDLTRGGQASQAADVLKRLSPEGQLMQLTKQAEKNGKTVSTKDAQKFMEWARKRQVGVGGGPREAQFLDILDRMNKGEKVSTAELEESVSRMLDTVKANSKSEKVPKEPKPRVRDKVLSHLEERAEKAMKELQAKQNLGFAKKIEKPDIVLYAEIFAHQLAKKAVNIADFTEMLVKQAGEPYRQHAKEIYHRANKLIRGADKKFGPDKAKMLEKFLKERKFDPKDEKALRKLAEDINDLEGKQGLEADMQMQRILNKYEKSNPFQMSQTIRYMMMLLNESTQSLNLISGPIMMTYRHMLDIFLTPFDIAMSKMVKGRGRKVTFKQGPGILDSALTPMIEWFKGLRTGGKAGFFGVDPEGITSQHDFRGLAFKGKYNPLGWGERALGVVSKAPDYATFNASRNMELRKMAYLDALNNKVGKGEIKAHIKKFLADPPAQALEEAGRQGKKTTFQYSEGLAGALSRSRLMRYGATTAVPFVKTPTNIMITGLENTPAGILKGMYEIYMHHKKPDKVSQKEIMQTFASSIIGGTGALGGIGYLLEELGILTGDYESSDRDAHAVADFSGKGKFKFNTTAFGRMFEALITGQGKEEIQRVSKYQPGDEQLDYNRLQPIAMPVAMGATFSQQRDKPMGERLQKTGKSTLSSALGMSALQGVQQTLDVPDNLETGDKIFAAIGNTGEAYAKSYSPSAIAREAQRQDPIQRKTSFNEGFVKDVGDYYQSRWVDGWLGLKGSKELPARVTNLGDTKQNIDPYLNTLKSEKTQFNEAAKIIDDMIRETGDEKLAPKAASKTFSGRKKKNDKSETVHIEPKRYAKLQEDTGKAISKRIISLPIDKRSPDNIQKIYDEVREAEMNKVKKEMGYLTK